MVRFLSGLMVILGVAMGAPAMASNSAYDYSFTSIDGAPLAMEQYKGKAVLVVNTASRCGFTYQYEGLQALWQTYRDKGLVVLGVPSNNFGGQEPGTETEIKEFCAVNFSVDFPMTEKVDVTGGNAHPMYRWMAEQAGGKAPQWNFYKYLIDPEGRVVELFPSQTKPDSPELATAVEKVLPK